MKIKERKYNCRGWLFIQYVLLENLKLINSNAEHSRLESYKRARNILGQFSCVF